MKTAMKTSGTSSAGLTLIALPAIFGIAFVVAIPLACIASWIGLASFNESLVWIGLAFASSMLPCISTFRFGSTLAKPGKGEGENPLEWLFFSVMGQFIFIIPFFLAKDSSEVAKLFLPITIAVVLASNVLSLIIGFGSTYLAQTK